MRFSSSSLRAALDRIPRKQLGPFVFDRAALPSRTTGFARRQVEWRGPVKGRLKDLRSDPAAKVAALAVAPGRPGGFEPIPVRAQALAWRAATVERTRIRFIARRSNHRRGMDSGGTRSLRIIAMLHFESSRIFSQTTMRRLIIAMQKHEIIMQNNGLRIIKTHRGIARDCNESEFDQGSGDIGIR